MQIDSLSIEELATLRDEVTSALNNRISARQRELQNEIERVGALGSVENRKPLETAPAKPKYQKGELTWSGRGTQPSWVKQHLALGGSLDELKVHRLFP